MRIRLAVCEILADKAFTATDVLISQSFVVAFVHLAYVRIALIWGFPAQLGLWKSVHLLWRYKLNEVCDNNDSSSFSFHCLPVLLCKVCMPSSIVYLVSYSPKMPIPNLLLSIVNKLIIFNTSQLKAEISIVATPPGLLFLGHKYLLLEITQTSRPTDSPGSGKTITIVEAIVQLTKIAGE